MYFVDWQKELGESLSFWFFPPGSDFCVEPPSKIWSSGRKNHQTCRMWRQKHRTRRMWRQKHQTRRMWRQIHQIQDGNHQQRTTLATGERRFSEWPPWFLTIKISSKNTTFPVVCKKYMSYYMFFFSQANHTKAIQILTCVQHRRQKGKGITGRGGVLQCAHSLVTRSRKLPFLTRKTTQFSVIGKGP